MAVDWDNGGADDYWANGLNWAGDVAPVDGQQAFFNTSPQVVDLNGTAVVLPASEVFINKLATIKDLANPLAPVSITCKTFKIQNHGGSEIHVPIIANTLFQTTYRLGTTKFFDTITAPEVRLGRGDVSFYDDVNATTEFNVTFDDANSTTGRLSPHPVTAAIPTLTTPAVFVGTNPNCAFFADGIVDASTITVQDAARYFAVRDGAMGDGTTNVTLDSGGYLGIGVAQTALPASINVVGTYSGLGGDMTGATYGGGGNVSFVPDSIFAPTAGPSPTRANLGGDATLYQGVLPTSKILTVGDDESLAIYKGAAIGTFSGDVSGMELTAETGSGDLQVVVTHAITHNIDQNNKFFGDGTSTTADIIMVNGAAFRNRYTLNGDYDYIVGGEPTRIDTFNIQGEVGNEGAKIMDHWNSPRTHIKEGQTWNISNGSWFLYNHFAGFGQHGTVNLSNGGMRLCQTAFVAGTDTLALNLSGTTSIDVTSGNLEFLEALDGEPGNGSFSYSGTPVVALAHDLVYSFDYSGSTPYPILADLLQNADIGVDGTNEINIDSDLRIGHEKYFIWSWSSSFAGNTKSIDSGTGAKLVPAGNAPGGETNVLGIAPNPAGYRPNRINVEVSAPGAIVRVGSDNPNRIYPLLQSKPFNAEVEFYQAITADLLELRSGTTKMMVSQSLSSLDIGPGTQLWPLAGTTTTVTGTLSGTGDIRTDGSGAVLIASAGTLAPGTSVGALGDGSGKLVLANGATYSLEVADPSAGAGTGYDTVKVSILEAVGTLTIDLAAIDGLTSGQTSTSDVYVVATAPSHPGDFTLPNVTVTGTGWDTSGATLGFNGNNLELSGVEYTGAAGSPFDTWAMSGVGVTFDGDANGDGVEDGIAFLLGAANPNVDANDLLPEPTEDGSGGLVMTFTMLDAATRGTASLKVEHSGDLGATDAWGPVSPNPLAIVPDATGPVGGVNFTVSGGPGTLNVVATIPAAGNTIGGKLFGRLVGVE